MDRPEGGSGSRSAIGRGRGDFLPGGTFALAGLQCTLGRKALEERAALVRRRIAELLARWPRHSVPPAMWAELEELEEELAALARESADGPPRNEGNLWRD